MRRFIPHSIQCANMEETHMSVTYQLNTIYALAI